MSTNAKQVASGVIDSSAPSILKSEPPEINGVEGYKSLDVILTAQGGRQGRQDDEDSRVDRRVSLERTVFEFGFAC